MTPNQRRALVIEDEPDVRALLTELLQQNGFAVAAAGTGASGLAAVREHDPDVVTLDLNLPDLDGFEVCRRIRAISDAYLIMLTGRPDEIDRLVGLETGADDYLSKPFSPRELSARVRAMMRRPRWRIAHPDPTVSTRAIQLGELVVDVDGRAARLRGRDLDLTRIEFELLAVLVGGPARTWARETLMQKVWGVDWGGDTHLVEVHVANLRRKLGDDARTGRYIRTVRGVGYRLGPGGP